MVDPDARREAVTEAVFRVICRDGLESASLRAIAAESGLAVGSVRHYFSSHGDLTMFALATLKARLTARLMLHIGQFERMAPADQVANARNTAQAIFSELLPLSAAQADEATVWLAFLTAARTRPELRTHVREMHKRMRDITERILSRLQQAKAVRPNLDPALEAERLCSLLDGLTLNGLVQPDLLPPQRMLGVLRTHLDQLEP